MLAVLDLGFHVGIFLGIKIQDPLNVHKVLSPYLCKNPTQKFPQDTEKQPIRNLQNPELHPGCAILSQNHKFPNSKFLPDSM
jgi:hypothetical protein